MFDALVSAIQTFFSHPEFLVPTLWVALGCTLGWYLLSAQQWQEIDSKELHVLWKTHKQFNNCSAKKFEPIVKGTKTVGYKCECGHQHLQKRPIINFGS